MKNQINISPNQLLAHLQKAHIVKPEEKSMPAAGTNSQRAVLPTRAMTVNPMNRLMYRGSRNIIEPNRSIDYSVLRRISEKAWLINAIIGHLSRQVQPFLKPSTDNNIRGFQIRLKDKGSTPSAEDKDLIKRYTAFFVNTGFGDDPDREDKLVQHATKAIRDVYTLDQVTTELQRTKTRKAYAFWAVDPATILKCSEEGYYGNDRIKYIQQVQLQTTAMFTRDDLIFDYMNPRTDVDHSGYGYSYVEQAIELILAMINSFVYNSGFFTEDRLPRGMLLLQGDADTEEVEMMEDYLINIMSGGPGSKWRVPILPAGASGTGDAGRKVEWVSLQGSNKDMEFSQWTETIWSSVSALFGVDLEELGIKTSKSGSVLGDNVGPKIDASKARGLATSLSFLESHYQKILDKLDPRFDFEFMGYERDDPSVKNSTREAELRTFKTIDEIRVESGLKPFKQPWSMIPLNPYAVQLFQSSQQGGGDAAAGGQAGDPSGAPGAAGDDQGGDTGDGAAAGKDPFSRYKNMITGGDDNGADAGEKGPNAGTGQKSGRSIFDAFGSENDGEANNDGDSSDNKKAGRGIKDGMHKSITPGSVNETIEIIV